MIVDIVLQDFYIRLVLISFCDSYFLSYWVLDVCIREKQYEKELRICLKFS